MTASETRPARSREMLDDYLLSEEQIEAMYRYMLLARRLEERMMTLNRQGRADFVIAGAGQEAAQVGAGLALKPGVDYVAPYYRDLGVMLVLGMSPREAMLNALAKRDDPNSFGRQMPSHWSSAERHVITQSSVVATQLVHVVGVALAAKMRNDPIVAFASCGEGSTSRGDFHEALNFAAIHKLPVIFYVENNGYAISERTEKEMPLPHVVDRAAAYGIQSAVVDGLDAVAVYQTVRPAVDQARRGAGPFLIEAKCFRLWSHSSDDDQRRYRPREEIEDWTQRDPVALFRARIEEDCLFPTEDLDAIEAGVEVEVRAAAQWAFDQPDPVAEDALGFVYREHSDG